MGRRRIIDRDALLDAAERVVAREGAARLTVEAVATEAGISKAGVLYDGGTKNALVEAVIRRAFDRDDRLHRRLEVARTGTDDAVIGARIDVAAMPQETTYGPAALHLGAAMLLDDALRREMQERQARVIERIVAESGSPRGALLAYLAVEGLKLLENLDLFRFDDGDRRDVLADIQLLARSTDPATIPTEETDP